jgi:hypothetical protein
MSKIYVEINRALDFNIEIYKDPVSQLFFQQLVDVRAKHYDVHWPWLVDTSKYTINYFIDLVNRAREIGAVDWTEYEIRPEPEYYERNQEYFNIMHKDLEVRAGIEKYAGFDREQIEIIDDLHCCLHSLETVSAPLDYQFKNRGIAMFQYRVGYDVALMPEPVKFKRELLPGEVMLDYCYVGKEPFFCMMHGDDSILQQTCKMIDRVSLSWKLHVHDDQIGTRWGPDPWPDDVDAELTAWWWAHKQDMDALGYSLQKVLDHTGFCTVGRIDDLSKLQYIKTTPNIQITDYQLIE